MFVLNLNALDSAVLARLGNFIPALKQANVEVETVCDMPARSHLLLRCIDERMSNGAFCCPTFNIFHPAG
jgi:hypothetical protein